MADNIRQETLEEALKIVTKDRNSQYGDPEKNFETIADLWATYTGQTFTPYDVAVMMILVKVSRIVTSPQVLDHWVDIAGYAACGAEARPNVP